MHRREFISLLGGAVAAWPLAARAQQGKLARIGGLVLTSADAQGLSSALRDGLREQGYVEGQNFLLKVSSADGNTDRLPELAAELVSLPVDGLVRDVMQRTLRAEQDTTPDT